MEKVTLTLPMMYADHHVIEIRRLISSNPGIESIYASSCFHVVEIEYDDSKIEADTIRKQLEEAGYLGEMVMPVETGTEATNGKKAFFRHTSVLEQTGNTVSFAQKAPYEGRPLWPCPGVGAIQREE